MKKPSMLLLSAWAQKRGLSASRARLLCVNGRVPGVKQVGTLWFVPSNARVTKPEHRGRPPKGAS